jgi:hypothetical protein
LDIFILLISRAVGTCQGKEVIGFLTDRDILRKIHKHEDKLQALR